MFFVTREHKMLQGTIIVYSRFCFIMWKRKKYAFVSFKAKVEKKRAGKEEAASALEYITVQCRGGYRGGG